MDTTAEGVETDAQLQALRDKGCTEIQGFLISQAIDPDGIGQGTSRCAAGGSDGAPAETQDEGAENRNRAA
jgi:EAL domain-containing protein (putative c-di-GMP-specific phosphodiesterase class I)